MKNLTIGLLIVIIGLQVGDMVLDEYRNVPCDCDESTTEVLEVVYESVELLMRNDSVLNVRADTHQHFIHQGLREVNELTGYVLVNSKHIRQLFDHVNRY